MGSWKAFRAQGPPFHALISATFCPVRHYKLSIRGGFPLTQGTLEGKNICAGGRGEVALTGARAPRPRDTAAYQARRRYAQTGGSAGRKRPRYLALLWRRTVFVTAAPCGRGIFGRQWHAQESRFLGVRIIASAAPDFDRILRRALQAPLFHFRTHV